MKNLIERISNIQNAQRLGRKQVIFSSPFGEASNSLRRSLLRVLVREGYLASFSVFQSSTAFGLPAKTFFTLFLKYGTRGEPAIRDIRALSRSSRRLYLSSSALWQPQFLDGTLIISTPCGLLTDREARELGVGGEVLRGVRLFYSMLSLSIPSTITLAFAPGYLQRSGPRGSFRRVTGSYRLRLLETFSERRLFLSFDPSIPIGSHPSLSAQSARLSRLAAQREGLIHGYRRRLRLVGVGFRATQRTTNSSSQKSSRISFKLGFSHDVEKELAEFQEKGVILTPSRLEGRTKGTLISLEANDLSRLNQCAASVCALRYPDPYKGKGIQYDREVIILKKGKREG